MFMAYRRREPSGNFAAVTGLKPCMKQFLDFMRHVRRNGAQKADRTGTGTLSVFGHQMRFDLAAGFPLVTTKRVHFKSIAYELLWFLRGETNTKYLRDHGVTIWDEWADAEWRARPGLRQAMALLAHARRPRDRPDRAGGRAAAHATRIRAASSSAPGTWASSTR